MVDPIYFLVARAKAGEIDALGRLAPSTQALVRPMLDFPTQKQNDKRPPAAYFAEKIREITASWGTAHEIALDFSRYPPESAIPDGRHLADYVFDLARQHSLKAIPVIAPLSQRGPGSAYLDAVARIARKDGRGATLRLPYECFSDGIELEQALAEATKLTGVPAHHIDLLFDAYSLEFIASEQKDEDVLAHTLRIAAGHTRNHGYRRVVFVASNMPSSLTRHRKGEVLRVARTEFRAWRRLIADPEYSFVRFGDYGVIHPTQVESEKPVIPPSRVRLADDDEYFLYKGPRDAIRRVAQSAVADQNLKSSSSSWGANAIRECAAGYGDSGGPAQWVARDTNMHIENTVTAVKKRLAPTQAAATQTEDVRRSPWLQETLSLKEDDYYR
jgi:hypothetical protein